MTTLAPQRRHNLVEALEIEPYMRIMYRMAWAPHISL